MSVKVAMTSLARNKRSYIPPEGDGSPGEDVSDTETPEEKRLRLAKIYLEEIQRKEAENEELSVNDRLQQKELEESQKTFKDVAGKFVGYGEISRHKDKAHRLSLTCLALSSKGQALFTASKSGDLVKWNIEGDRPKMACRRRHLVTSKKSAKKADEGRQGHRSTVNAIATSRDDRFVATGDDDNLVFVWTAGDLTFLKAFKGHRGQVTGLAFARNRPVLYSCSADRSVKSWDLDQMGYVETLNGHQDAVNCITSGVTCDFLTGGDKDGSVRLWKAAEEVQLVFNSKQGYSVEQLDKINADYFVTIGDCGNISGWTVRKKSPICSKQHAHGIDPSNDTPRWLTSLAVLPCSNLMATGSCDGLVRLWKFDPKSKEIGEVGAIPVVGFVNSLAFSGDGNVLYAAVGQEHRRGRWWKISEAKNELVCIRLNFES